MTLHPTDEPWRVRILVVEDDEDLQKIMKMNLEQEGFEVVQALDGKQAVEAVRKSVPDVVLLDLMMPEMDGFETCRRIKSIDSTREIPVMIVSAKDAVKDKLKAFGFHADDYLTKPYEYDELIARIYLHLNKVSNTNELRHRERARAEKKILAEVSSGLQAIFYKLEKKVQALQAMAPKKTHASIDEIARNAGEMLRIIERMREDRDPLYESSYLDAGSVVVEE